MDTICAKSTSSLLLAILLGAVLSVLCMSTAVHTLTHDVHQHALVRISCTDSGATDTGCMPGHSSLIYTLTQSSAAVAIPLIFLLLIFSAFYILFTVGSKTVSKQFYKTRWRLTQQVYAEHILHWLAMLQKQDSYKEAVT